MSDEIERGSAPPAQGVRLGWEDIPESVRELVEARLGSPVVEVHSQSGGFSPGLAARIRTADDQRLFLKAAGLLPNPDTANVHRREARIAAKLPAEAPVPRFHWMMDDARTGWVVVAFDLVDGEQPAQPWREDELLRVLGALSELSEFLTPSPLAAAEVGTASEALDTHICGWRQLLIDPPSVREGLDAWSRRHLDALARLEAGAGAAAAGNTLLHFDLRADNMLLTEDRVWIVDWPHVRVGAAWVDLVFFAPSVAMAGGMSPEELITHHPPSRAADADALNAGIAAVAGFFIRQSLLPAPPGLPTLRAFQAAQGAVACQWLGQRLGWR
jgi:aminoglycoside phosphotransferase (APT) family kinase protein